MIRSAKKNSHAADPISTEFMDRASALMKARQARRPVETLLPLTQRFLGWWTVVHGLPLLDTKSLKPLAREFRALAFECGPGRIPRWTKEQSSEAETLFASLVSISLEMSALELPEFGRNLREQARPVLLHWLWTHLDYHVSALTIGLLGSGLLAQEPEEKGFKDQVHLREKTVSSVGALLALSSYISGTSGKEMPVQDALMTVSALLDTLAETIEEAFLKGGPRACLLAQMGGWARPDYPYDSTNLEELLKRPEEKGKGG